MNITLRDEFTRTRARVSALEDQCNEKDAQFRKLQTVKQRLESLCRFQQDKLKEKSAGQPSACNASEQTDQKQTDKGEDGSAAPDDDCSSAVVYP